LRRSARRRRKGARRGRLDRQARGATPCHREGRSMSSRTRVRFREALRAPVVTTDPAALAAYAAELRPVVAPIRSFAEPATAPRPVYSREHARDQILKAIRVVETRLDAAAPRLPEPAPEHGAPIDTGASPAL